MESNIHTWWNDDHWYLPGVVPLQPPLEHCLFLNRAPAIVALFSPDTTFDHNAILWQLFTVGMTVLTAGYVHRKSQLDSISTEILHNENATTTKKKRQRRRCDGAEERDLPLASCSSLPCRIRALGRILNEAATKPSLVFPSAAVMTWVEDVLSHRRQVPETIETLNFLHVPLDGATRDVVLRAPIVVGLDAFLKEMPPPLVEAQVALIAKHKPQAALTIAFLSSFLSTAGDVLRQFALPTSHMLRFAEHCCQVHLPIRKAPSKVEMQAICKRAAAVVAVGHWTSVPAPRDVLLYPTTRILQQRVESMLRGPKSSPSLANEESLEETKMGAVDEESSLEDI